MTFIRAKNKRLYPANRILSIGKDIVRRGEGIIDIEIDGEGTVECYAHAVQDFLRTAVSAFMAQPETYIVHLDDETHGAYWKQLVVGWATALDGRLYPVTAEGVNDGYEKNHYVLTPDGRVSQIEGGSWESLDAMITQEHPAAQAA
jgi:hypothetical protein